MTYQDTRLIERNKMAAKPSFYLSNGTPIGGVPPIKQSFPKFPAPFHRRIVDPQSTFSRALASTSAPFRKTVLSVGTKKGLSSESPIVKVTTHKQVFYPSFHDETEELIEIRGSSAHRLSAVRAQPPRRAQGYDEHREREYEWEEEERGYEERRERRKRRRKEKRHDKSHKTMYVPKGGYVVEAVPNVQTVPAMQTVQAQSFVPMYMNPAVYGSQIYYPMASSYGPQVVYAKQGSGK